MDTRLQRRVQRYGWDAAASHYEPGWALHDRIIAVDLPREALMLSDLICDEVAVLADRLAIDSEDF